MDVKGEAGVEVCIQWKTRWVRGEVIMGGCIGKAEGVHPRLWPKTGSI